MNSNNYQQPALISLGNSIRHVTSYLLDEYAHVIKSLSTQPRPEIKKQMLVKMIKNLKQNIKALLRFIKNSKKHKKMFNVFLITSLLSERYMSLHRINGCLYSTKEVCYFYRTPTFKIEQSVQVINMQAHNNLKKAIWDYVIKLPDFGKVSKEVQYEFMEKYLYRNDISKQYLIDANVINENMCLLNIPSVMCMFKYSEDGSEVGFKDNMFYMGFYRIVLFKLIPFFYNEKVTFFCKEMKLNHNNPAFVNDEQTGELYNKIYTLNSILQEKIVIDINANEDNVDKMDIDDKNESDNIIDLQLNTVKDIIDEFVKEHIFSFIFEFYTYKINKYLTHFSKPIKFSRNNNNNTPSIVIEYKPDQSITPPHLKDKFIITITPIFTKGKLIFKSSQHIVSYNPFIYIDNHEECFNITSFPYQKLITSTLYAFQDIFLYEIYNNLIQMPSTFLDIKYEIYNTERKFNNKYKLKNRIECVIPNHNNLILFSICLNLKGEINFIDYDSSFNEYEIDIIKKHIIDYIKHNNNENVIEYNEFVFRIYIKVLFNFSRTILKLSKEISNEHIYYIFTFTNPKYFSSKITNKINIVTTFNTNHKLFHIHKANLSIHNSHNESINHDIMKFISKYVPSSQFLSSKQDMEQLLHIINQYFKINDEAIKNIQDTLSFINISKLNSQNLFIENEHSHLITISFSENNLKEIIGYACRKKPQSNEIYEIGKSLIDKIELTNANYFCKVYLRKSEIDKRLHGITLHEYSIFENKFHSHFNPRNYCVTNYILTKLKKPDINPSELLLNGSLYLLILFIKKISTQLKLLLSNTKYDFTKKDNLFVCPIFLQFKLSENKILYLQFTNVYNEKINPFCKYKPIPMRSHFQEVDSDLDKELIIGDDVKDILRYEKYFLINDIYEKLSSHITTYPLLNNVYVSDNVFNNDDKQLFLCFSNHMTFKIFVSNYYVILIEVKSIENVRIQFFRIINYQKCRELMSMLCSFIDREGCDGFKCDWKLNEETWELIASGSYQKYIIEDLEKMALIINKHYESQILNNN